MRCIALASGKGGVGKTFLAAAFGLALAEKGASVLLVDGDMGLRNLDIPLGLEGQVRRTAWDLARGKCAWQEAVLPAAPGLDLLPAADDRDWKDISKTDLSAVLKEGARRYDYILIDCPAGLGKGLRFAEKTADQWLLVAGPSRASLHDVHRTAEFLRGKKPAAVVFNQVRTGKAAAVSFEEMAAETAGLPIAGAVPYSAEADRLAQEGRLASCQSGAFREAVQLVLQSFLGGTLYPSARWQAILQKAAEENALPAGERPAKASSLLLRQRQIAARWRRR